MALEQKKATGMLGAPKKEVNKLAVALSLGRGDVSYEGPLAQPQGQHLAAAFASCGDDRIWSTAPAR